MHKAVFSLVPTQIGSPQLDLNRLVFLYNWVSPNVHSRCHSNLSIPQCPVCSMNTTTKVDVKAGIYLLLALWLCVRLGDHGVFVVAVARFQKCQIWVLWMKHSHNSLSDQPVLLLTNQSVTCSLTTSHLSTCSGCLEPRPNRYYFRWYRLLWSSLS